MSGKVTFSLASLRVPPSVQETARSRGLRLLELFHVTSVHVCANPEAIEASTTLCISDLFLPKQREYSASREMVHYSLRRKQVALLWFMFL